jgi:hypothetical protein
MFDPKVAVIFRKGPERERERERQRERERERETERERERERERESEREGECPFESWPIVFLSFAGPLYFAKTYTHMMRQH